MKSPTGSRVPQPQLEMLEKRKKFAQDDYDPLPGGNAGTALAAKEFVAFRLTRAAWRRKPMTTKETSGPVRGSGDFLRDMGYEDPEEMRVKFTLANTIALAIEQHRLKQAEVAKLTGLAQPDISRIV